MNDTDSISQADPFDEPLEPQKADRLILNDTFFAAARGAITVDGMDYSFLKPPYMNFDDHVRAKQKLKEAYTQREFLLLYGYSGCGKTTILTQFAEKYSNYIFLLRDFDSLSPAQMLVEMGECINMPIKLRTNEMSTLKRQIEALQGVMFLFDEVTASSNSSFRKLEMLRRIHDETHVPIVICGVPLLHKTIYASNRFDHYCSLISRMDEHEMHGMKRTDAGNYIEMVGKEENVQFSYPAQQALITTALNSGIGGINAFTTIIGRCITLARVHYYNSPGHSIPNKARCVRTEVPGGAAYPGAKLILTLPVTPDPVHIYQIRWSAICKASTNPISRRWFQPNSGNPPLALHHRRVLQMEIRALNLNNFIIDKYIYLHYATLLTTPTRRSTNVKSGEPTAL